MEDRDREGVAASSGISDQHFRLVGIFAVVDDLRRTLIQRRTNGRIDHREGLT